MTDLMDLAGERRENEMKQLTGIDATSQKEVAAIRIGPSK
jgi:hypothetical protein